MIISVKLRLKSFRILRLIFTQYSYENFDSPKRKLLMESFEQLKLSTYCPFASSAKVARQLSWNLGLDFLGNIQSHALALKEFTKFAQERKYHGFVSRVYLGNGAKNFETTRIAFKEYLFGLAKFDQDCAKCLEQDKINLEWQFSFNKLRMFLNVFSPCYSLQHSKYIYSEDSIYIFFQPEYSFSLCGSKPLTKLTTQSIRDKFYKAGKGYDGELIDQRIEAYIYMFPEKPGDQPVNWWE
jgi:hypothetical protein